MDTDKRRTDKLPGWIERSSVAKFNTLAAARAYRDRCKKMQMIVLGDDGLFWVAVPKITEWLVREGYEYAE